MPSDHMTPDPVEMMMEAAAAEITAETEHRKITERLLESMTQRCEAAEVALAQAREREAWQPIGTAPQDGTTIVGFAPELESIYMGGVEFMRWVRGGWEDPSTHRCRPTHWKLLPDPPAEPKKEGA